MKKKGSTKAKDKRGEEDGDEDVEHAFLRVLGADLDDFFAVGDAGGGCAFELDVGLDEFDGAVGAGGDGLGAGAGEPVDHGAAGDEAEDERRVEERELVHVFGEAVGEGHDDREDHRGGADDGGADEHGLGGGFEGVARAVVGFEHFLGAFEIDVDVEVLLQLALDVGNLFDQRELVDGLRVVGDRAVGVDGDRDWAHAEEAEGHQTEGEDRRGDHQAAETHVADEVADGHQKDHGEADVVGGEIAGDEAGENAERCAAFFGGGDDFLDVARFGGGEDFHEFGNDRACERAAGDDRRELPPLRRVIAERRNDQRRDPVGEGDGDDRGDPDERGERRFVIHLVGVAVLGFGDRAVDEVGGGAGDEHDDAHDEDPDEELHLDRGALDAEEDEGDERDAGDAVGFEAVGAGADRVARVVAGAVGDDAGVARVVFLDLEDDLHQVGADVGDLGEDAARDAQRSRAERFADGEADEAGAGVVAGDEEQNEQHHQQLDADEHHADAHAGFERRVINRIGLAAEAGESCAGVGEGVDANAEPGHAVAAGDADQAEEENDWQSHRDGLAGNRSEDAEVQNDDDGDEDPEQHEELALREEVGFAGFVDEFGDVAHRAMHGQIFEAAIDDQAESKSEDAEEDAEQEQLVAVDAEKRDRGEVRELEVRFASGLLNGLSGEGLRCSEQRQCGGNCAKFRNSTCQ